MLDRACGDRPSVLIANSDAHDQLFCERLIRLGCDVHRVCHERDLTPSLERLSPSLLVMDLEFPSMGGCGNGSGLDVWLRLQTLGLRYPVVFLTSRPNLAKAVAAMQAGASSVIQTPASNDSFIELATLASQAKRNNAVGCGVNGGTILGRSQSISQVCEMIGEVASTEATVMILGESGTGKELVAREIHRQSRRHQGPFVAVNMSSIPEPLTESLFFGHEKGAFTSAERRQKGFCERADGGTLFLDEIGEMEITLQPKLLRFLQDGKIQSVGSQNDETSDCRIITATNRSPEELVANGVLRQDLYFRLHVVPIHLPPLRERREDIAVLAKEFVRRSAIKHHRNVHGLSLEAIGLLESYDWPGNVRQLENLMERLTIFCKSRQIEADQFPNDFRQHRLRVRLEKSDFGRKANSSPSATGDTEAEIRLSTIQYCEREAIIDALEKADGNVVRAAKIVGLGQATVYRRIRQYRIPHRAMRKR